MKLGINLKIAKTHLLAKKKQTLVAMLGVTFGIAMFTLMISFMTGVNNLLEDTMLSVSPDIHIYNDIKPVKSSILDEYYNNDKNHLNITHQPTIVQISVTLTILFLIIGLINGILALITFKNKTIQQSHF